MITAFRHSTAKAIPCPERWRGDLSTTPACFGRRALTLVMLLAFTVGATRPDRAADIVPEPDGYRLDDYRAPTPLTLKGATVLNAPALHHLMLSQPLVVIDVLPQPPRPANLPATTFWHPPTRLDIPGSIWLANTGYGQLSPEMDSYFHQSLDNLTLGDPDHPLAFYCEAQCWMSWNAAKRALSYGYRHVYWFPGGMQAWRQESYPSLPNTPLPLK